MSFAVWVLFSGGKPRMSASGIFSVVSPITSVAAPAMLADAAKSEVPMVGYAVPYAVSCTLLTLSGMFIVLLVK